jgi:hypothetical protein
MKTLSKTALRLEEKPPDFPPSHYFRLAARLCKQGFRSKGHRAMKSGFQMMLVEGRLKQDEFDALMLQHHMRHL